MAKENKKPINVLSVFDGISCGQEALRQMHYPVAKYYAAEINVHAIKVTMKNHPATKQLGYVEHVKAKLLPRIDLILAGSPCQGFSSGGKRLNFDDPRSKLFFEFVRIYKECKKINPKVKFLLENVRMKREWQDVITKYVGVEPIMINSAKISAQNRHRLYWTNGGEIEQPKDQGIMLIDILDKPYYDNEEHGKLRTDTQKKISYNGNLSVLNLHAKHPCLTVCDDARAVATGMKTYRRITITEMERLQSLPDDYTAGIPITHRHAALGNGWEVATIKHILKSIL